MIREGTISSPRRQHAQNAMDATAQTAASNVLDRSRPLKSAYMCSMVMGGRLGRREESGINFCRPLRACSSISAACQGAPLIMCQARRAASQEFIVEAEIDPA